jgi:hypothetical protein
MEHPVTQTQHAWMAEAVATCAAVLVAMMLLPDPDPLRRERHFFMSKIAAADETGKAVREGATPPARNPEAAVEEEYQIALRQGTAQALELFIARHPDSALAEKARADLRRLSR